MLHRLFFCIALAAAMLLPGCGGGDSTPLTPAAVPAFVPASQTSTVGTAGGTVTLTAADGTQYTLAVPAGALAKETALSLTTAAPGEGQRFRVVAGPDGLVFQGGLAATLTIRLPAGRELPAAGGLIYSGSPVPSTRNADGSIVLQLYQLSGSAVAKAGLAQLAQVLERLRPASTVAGSVLVCRSPNVNGGPEAGTASYDALDLASHLDCATAQIEDAVAADNFRGAAALALSLDALFQRASLTGSPFMDRAKALVCEGRQRALDTLTSVTITDLDDLQVIERVAQWDMFAQKLGHVCPGQPGLNAAVQPKIDDALTLMDVDPANITAADVSSSGYVEFKDSVDRTLQLRHRLVAIARSLGRPIAPIAPAGVRERAQAANDYTAEALASAQLQGRVEPAALKNLLPAPWAKCRNSGDYAPLMALVDVFGATDTLKNAAQYCGTQMSVEVLDNLGQSTGNLGPLGGLAAGQNQTTGSVRVAVDGQLRISGSITGVRCPAGAPNSEALILRLNGVEVQRFSAVPYLANPRTLSISALRAAAGLPTSDLSPQSLRLERVGDGCGGYWGATPLPLLSVTMNIAGPTKLAFWSTRGAVLFGPLTGGVYIADVNGGAQTKISDISEGVMQGRPSWSPDGARFVAPFYQPSGSSSGYLRIIDVNGTANQLTSGANRVADSDPDWSPDGSKIVFSRDDGNTQGLYTIYPDGSNLTALPGTAGARTPAWSPDGRLIAYECAGYLCQINADGTGQGPLGGASVLGGAPQWSPDGQKVVFRGNDGIMIMNRDGSGQSLIFSASMLGPDYFLTSDPSWSGDGTRIAIGAGYFSPGVNTLEPHLSIYSIKPDGTALTDLTHGYRDFYPGWSR